jgi:hypothetical protein
MRGDPPIHPPTVGFVDTVERTGANGDGQRPEDSKAMPTRADLPGPVVSSPPDLSADLVETNRIRLRLRCRGEALE